MLGELRAFEAVPELVAALGDPDVELCARACHALGKIGDPESAEALAAVAMDGGRPWFVRTAAAGACGQIGDPRTADMLVDASTARSGIRATPRRRARPARGRGPRRRLQRASTRSSPESVAHYWGLLDAAGATERAIDRAAAGERRVRRFVTAAARAGATARLEELRHARHAVGPLRDLGPPAPPRATNTTATPRREAVAT